MRRHEVTIDRAQLSDLETLNRISLESKRYWKYPEDWIENWKEDLKLKAGDFENQHIFKCAVSGKIIGFCAIQDQSNFYEVSHLWVTPTFIRRGIGKILLKHSIAEVVATGKDVQVVSDPNSEAFYAKMGFTTFDQVESYPVGRSLPRMKRPC